MKRWFIALLAVAFVGLGSAEAAIAQSEPESSTTVVDVTVWRSVANPAQLYLSTRPAGGRWRTGSTPLDMSALSRSGNFHQSNAVRVQVSLEGGGTAVVEVTVWRSVSNPALLYVSTRPEGGRWRTENTALDMAALSGSGNFHQSNAVRVAVEVAGAPQDSSRATAFTYVPSLDATVVDLRFFESGDPALPANAHVYNNRFDRQTARYINWLLDLRRAPGLERVEYSLETSIYRADRSVLTNFTSDFYIPEDWTSLSQTQAWGTGQASWWGPGTYHVELKVEGEVIARGTFEVVDRQIPRSGAFSDLREGLSWAEGRRLTHSAQVALRSLAGLHDADPSLAAFMAALPWMQQEPGGEGLQTLQQIEWLAREHPNVARRISTLPWIADGVTTTEWLGLQALALTATDSASAARRIAGYPWVRDDVTEDERWALIYLRELARTGELVEQVAAFPWLSDRAVSEDERWLLWTLQQLSVDEQSLARRVIDFSWMEGAIGSDERSLVWDLRQLHFDNMQLANRVVGYPWIDDTITSDERWFVSNLRELDREQPELAALVVDFPWAQDDEVTEQERWTLVYLREIANTGPLIERVTAFPWLTDDITEHERRLLRNLRDFAQEYPDIASRVVDFPWVDDDVTEHERWFTTNLKNLAREHPELAGLVVDFPWARDGDVTEHERYLVWNLRELVKGHPDLGSRFIELPWMQDDITSDERYLVWNLRELAEADPELGSRVGAIPWMQDDITSDERWVVWNLRELAKDEPELAGLIVDFEWVQDGITSADRWTVRYLREIAEAGGEAVVSMPFLEALSPADALATRALYTLARWAPDGLETVLQHPSISDGITDDEAVIVSTLWGVQSANPDLVETLLDPTQVTLEERVIELPHSGEVTLTIIRTEQGMERSMDLVEDAVRSVEELMATPLPTRQVTFLFEEAFPTTFFGAHYGTHIALSAKVDSMALSRQQAFRPITHEIAHYYWTGNIAWINEGIANLIEAVVDGSFEDLPERDRAFPCRFARRISDLEDKAPRQRSLEWRCAYSLGFRLFRDLYRDLGEDFWQGLQRLYQKALVDDDSDECEGTSLRACHVEAAFKEGASQEVIDIVDDVFDFWYEKREP